jgi:hypothetical protein
LKKYRTDCPYCTTLRPLASHLHELALACEFLGNSATYSIADSKRTVRTETISDWLKLASQLEEVKVDAWRFEHDLFCGTAADRVSSDSVHFTFYSTALTRFIFVTSALEEIYRFVDGRYRAFADANQIPEKSRPRSSSIKAAVLIDSFHPNELPLHFKHCGENYKGVFVRYLKDHQIELTGMQYAMEAGPAYALHFVRNLRNHVAHGVFPLIANPDYSWGIDFDREDLIQLLNQSCRMAAMYGQMLIRKFNSGFLSDEYQYCEYMEGPEFEYFLAHCNVDYINNLHIQQSFSLAGAFDYASRPWEKNTDFFPI